MNSGWQHTSTIAAEATGSIFLTETAGAANVVLLEAYGGNIRFTVRESALTGEDLNLLLNGSTLVDETTGADPTTNFSRAVPYGRIAALNGFDQPARRRQRHDAEQLAHPRRPVDRHLRRLPARRPARRTSAATSSRLEPGPTDTGDPGVGTVMTLRGEITPGLLTSRLSYITRIFGNFDDDQFWFLSTYLGGKTRTYGSNTPTNCLGAARPARAASTPRTRTTASTSSWSTGCRR